MQGVEGTQAADQWRDARESPTKEISTLAVKPK